MIRIEGLHFAVGSFALRDVCLHIAPGEYFVLLGPTGSGKTLLAECICGLNRIEAGRIDIGGGGGYPRGAPARARALSGGVSGGGAETGGAGATLGHWTPGFGVGRTGQRAG